MRPRSFGGSGVGWAVLLTWLLVGWCASAAAQIEPVQFPPLPTPNPPSATAPATAPAPASREAQLEERLRRMEAMNQQLLQQLQALSKKYDDLAKQVGPKSGSAPSEGAAGNSDQAAGDPAAGGLGQPRVGGRASPSVEFGGATAEGAGGAKKEQKKEEKDETKALYDAKPKKRKVNVSYGEGVLFETDDKEFQMAFHNLTQAEYRAFDNGDTGPGGPGTLHDSFFIPRQRWYFTGNATKNLEFYTVINRGYGSLDLLDAFLTFNYDPRLRLRIGRTKVPWLYEYIQISEGDLIAPERSVLAGNLALNRQNGAYFLGELFDKRVTYMTGVFNGPRRSFEGFNNSKDWVFYINTRPFLKTARTREEAGVAPLGMEGRAQPREEFQAGATGTTGQPRVGGRASPGEEFPAGATGQPRVGGRASPAVKREEPSEREFGLFEHLNLGASFDMGFEGPNQPTQPSVFRTANDQTTASGTGAAVLSPEFFAYNANVREFGQRYQWAAHAIWYYKAACLLAEYGGVRQGYSTNNVFSIPIQYEGFMVQGFWFPTGERLTRRVAVLQPRRDFAFKNGKITGPGAIELHARYSYLNISRNAFTSGLADPNLWTNQVGVIDFGLNWYLNFYTKIMLDYQLGMFGNPVTTGNPAHPYMINSHLYWLRVQLFF
jgi:phosphate-selective porin